MPERYSFWDLHVAIQDAMGWKDYHLHEFVLADAKRGRFRRIGIPDDEMPDERPCLAGWKVPIAQNLTYGSGPVRDRYDFGDDWEHVLEFDESWFPSRWRRIPALRCWRERMSAGRCGRHIRLRGVFTCQ